MELLLITLPSFFDGETDAVNKLLQDGCRRLHLRKPEASREQTAHWLEQIEPQFRRRIVLHDHHDLALQYGLGGIHLNSRNPNPLPEGEGMFRVRKPTSLKEESEGRQVLTISRSCHSIEEIKSVAKDYDYVFLSPIFDSISKPGYRAAFTREELTAVRDILSQNVYALGGITFDRLAEVEQLGFAGAAMMGGFWGKITET